MALFIIRTQQNWETALKNYYNSLKFRESFRKCPWINVGWSKFQDSFLDELLDIMKCFKQTKAHNKMIK